VLVCALDHITEFEELLPSRDAPSFEDVVAAKVELVRQIAASTSAVLVDPHYATGYLAATGALPRDVGLIVSLEDGIPGGDSLRETRLRAGWSVRKAAAAGADMVKLLWWYRPDADRELAAAQRKVVGDVVTDCAVAGLPLVVEPIWYPLPGEDRSSADWTARRCTGIVESAMTAEELGADLLKVEFPADLCQPDGARRAEDALGQLDAAVHRPWVILSAGAPFNVFLQQVDMGAHAGACGYIAGRSLWREAVAASGSSDQGPLTALLQRLEQLNVAIRTHGRPHRSRFDLPDVVAALPAGWYC
jgi:tagatose 1,6-diphosphate aldolase